jgi:hypothetical protein
MMGETANIQALGNLPYAQLIIMRHQTPYYLKNDTKKPKKIEIINDKDVEKYLKLIFDNPHAHKPNFLGIQLIDIDEVSGNVSITEIDKCFSRDTANFLKTKLSLKYFFNEIETYKNYILLKR